jgi:uncharacterized OsmC-like protein
VQASAHDDTLRRIVDATAVKLHAEPGRGVVRYRAAGAGGDGVRAEISIGRHRLVVDEPPSVGGQDAAANPVEHALAALLSCQVVTYRLWAARLGVPLDDIAIDVDGDLDVRGFFGLDDGVRPGFRDVRVTVTLTGPAEPERYRELAAAVDEHCPVLDLFRNPTPVSTALVVRGLGQDGTHE